MLKCLWTKHILKLPICMAKWSYPIVLSSQPLVTIRKTPCVIRDHNSWPDFLTHWGRMTHICVSKLTIIGSDKGLSPGRRQAIIWTNEISTIDIQTFSFKKIHFNMSSGKWRPFFSRPQCVNTHTTAPRAPQQTHTHLTTYMPWGCDLIIDDLIWQNVITSKLYIQHQNLVTNVKKDQHEQGWLKDGNFSLNNKQSLTVSKAFWWNKFQFGHTRRTFVRCV